MIHTIRTFTGRRVNPLRLKDEDIEIEDIAHALANICRFTGHTSHHYSVAQHSVYVSYNTPFCGLEGLMHDASEAYICDISRPLKYQWWMYPYRVAERMVQNAIDRRYGICRSFEVDKIVKQADNAVYEIENYMLFNNTAFDEKMKLPGYGIYPHGLFTHFKEWTPQEAKRRFHERFYELGGYEHGK